MNNIEILTEVEHFIAINKPAGLVVHGDGKREQETLVDWILEQYPEVQGVGESLILDEGTEHEREINRSGIVHRLDKETSGVMLIARTHEGHAHLKAQFKERTTEKTYHCFVYENIVADSGIIDEPIGREKGGVRRQATGRQARGALREAQTAWRVVERGNVSHEGKDFNVCFIEAKPKTGRMHQIRVHMKHVQHPLIGDSLYAPNRPLLLGFERLALHARKISFTDPSTNEHVEIEAPYPDDFNNAIVEMTSLF